ncbi:MAG: TolC family outer membrane protein [Granulosicoccaceae bacterium]
MRITTLAGCCALVLSLNSGSALANNLMDVYQMAVENDPTIIASEYQRRASEAAVDLAKSARMPTMGASISGGETVLHSSDLHQRDMTSVVQATLPLYNRGDNISVEQARSQRAAANADHADQRQSLISRTAEAYFGVLRAQDNVTFAKAEREAIYRQLDQAERRYDVGLVAITDVKEAQASYDSAVASVISAENQLNSANESLRVMTNSYVDNLHVLREQVALLPPAPNNVDIWVKTAFNQNPTVLAAREDLATAKLNVKQAGVGRYPSLDLVGTYQDADYDGSKAYSRDSESHSVELQLTVPIYTGGAVSSSKRQARFAALASEKTLEGIERNIERNVRTAFSTVEARISQVKALKRALESNEVRLEATEAGYDAGTRTAVDVLNAIRGTSSAAAQYAGARYDYILAMLDLQASVGLLGQQDLAMFNDWLEKPKAK